MATTWGRRNVRYSETIRRPCREIVSVCAPLPATIVMGCLLCWQVSAAGAVAMVPARLVSRSAAVASFSVAVANCVALIVLHALVGERFASLAAVGLSMTLLAAYTFANLRFVHAAATQLWKQFIATLLPSVRARSHRLGGASREGRRREPDV